MKAAYLTLGCKVNQYDTQAMEEILGARGYETVGFSGKADVYIINTCTVTAVADKKSRQMIHRAHEANPGAVLCVCGCLAQREAEIILAMDGVSAVIGTKNRGAVGEIVERVLAGENKINAVGDILHELSFERLRVKKSPERVRANIKICEGCNNFCSYCIIPYARGPVRSRPAADILEEARDLAASGVREVVLTGIHIGSYGKDLEGESLIGVIESIEQIEGIERIRLGSLEPSLLTDEFCRRARQAEKLCPHFHVSLQSGSASVLKRMNRKYTPGEYAAVIENVRRHFDNPAITTDIIAGFPGETQQEHEETLAFIRKIGFSRVHVFPYSEREGTAAAKMPGKVSKAVRKSRAAEISLAAEEMSQTYLTGFIGKTEKVLTEEVDRAGISLGHNERYIMVGARGAQPNTMALIKIEEICGDGLFGSLVK